MQELITLVSVIVAGISGIAGILWSKQYRDAKQAQLDVKDELINNLKELSTPKIKEIFDSTRAIMEDQIDNQETIIIELQETINKLNSEKSELATANKKLQKRIPTFVLPDSDKNYLNEFVTGSNMAVKQMGGTVDALSTMQGELINNKERMRNFVVTPEPAVAVTGGADPKVLISEKATKDEAN